MGKINQTKQERFDKEYDSIKKLSESELKRYENFFKWGEKHILSVNLWWVISWIPYILIWGLFIIVGAFKLDIITLLTLVICHSIYWFFSGKKSTEKLVNELQEDIQISLEVIDKVKEERLKK